MRIERHDAVAVVRMEAGRANAISPEVLEALNKLIAELASSDARAAVFVGSGNAFSAGLALPQLVTLGRREITAFIEEFDRTMLRLFELPKPVVAAVNGHAIAGGLVLALQADWRIATSGPAKLGLNEVELGIGLPSLVIETLRCQVPPASLVPVAYEGRLFSPEEALALGLVHELAPPAEVLDRAIAKARALAALPAEAVRQVKTSLRAPTAALIRQAGAEVTEAWVDTWLSGEGQARLKAAVARLGQPQPKAPSPPPAK